jgi:phage shock protein C
MTRRTKFYRDKQNGKLSGVCSGISDYTGIDVTWVRLGMFLSFFMSQGITLLAYIGLSIFSPKKPSNLYIDREEQKFWQGVRQSPRRTARDVKSRFREIDRRLADVELYYTSNNRQLSDEIERLR